jgi:hypothetical protein
VWAAYNNRVFLFTYCPTTVPDCLGPDYFNDPGDALAQGANLDKILFLNDKNQMFYERVPRTTSCIPDGDQTIRILYPQYCSFVIDHKTVTGKALEFDSPSYLTTNNVVVLTDGDCQPLSIATSGIPQLRWDKN